MIESVDGRAARELPPGAVVEVRRGRYDALLVRIERADFYAPGPLQVPPGRPARDRHQGQPRLTGTPCLRLGVTLWTAPGSG